MAYLQRRSLLNMQVWKICKSIFKSQWFFHFAFAQIFVKVLRLPHGIIHQKSELFSHKIAWLESFFYSFYLDLPVIAYFFGPLWILHLSGSKRFSLNHIVFCSICLILMVLTGIDVTYYPFSGSHINASIFQLINDPGNQIMPYITSYWYLVALILLSTYALYKCKGSVYRTLYAKESSISKKILIGLIFSFGLFVSARGGFYLKPLRSINIGKFVHPKLISYTNNGPFEIFSSIDAIPEEEPKFGHPNLLNWRKEYLSNSDIKKNVCLIIVESLGKEYIDMEDEELTPFIHSLRKISTTFTHCYSSGRRSKEMPPSIFLGIPKLLKDDYISSNYSRNQALNAFGLYEKNGYNSSFYHGGANGTLEFESFLKHTGLPNYYGMSQYPNQDDYDGAWGISDRKYLSYYANELDKKPKPFFSSIFTISSHHPYGIEPNFKKSLKKGPYENSQSIRYVDTSLALFFKKIQNKPWFKNTLFVITADHTSISKNPFYQYNIGRFHVPFILYNPQEPIRKTIESTCTPGDIIPTLNKMTGIKGSWFSAGQDARKSADAIAVMRSDNEFTSIQYPFVLYTGFDGKPVKFFKIDSIQNQMDLKLTGVRFKAMHEYTLNYVRQHYYAILNNKWNAFK